MKNFIAPGNHVDFIGPSGGVLSGAGVLIGAALFGVAIAAVAENAKGSMVTEGVVVLPKLGTDVVAAGAKLNWNNSTKQLQLATSTADGVATAVEAAGNGVTSVKVRLTPQ